MPYYTVISGPSKPPRVFVDGVVVGFPNPTELAEFMKPYDLGGYKKHQVHFAEADDWQRYMDGHFAKLDEVSQRLGDLQTRVARIDSWVGTQPATT